MTRTHEEMMKSKSDAEFSPYQKRIEAMDNAILCVAEAEKLVFSIGLSLLEEHQLTREKTPR